jgi:hypothetical protein
MAPDSYIGRRQQVGHLYEKQKKPKRNSLGIDTLVDGLLPIRTALGRARE